jgi:hypothetical protein
MGRHLVSTRALVLTMSIVEASANTSKQSNFQYHKTRRMNYSNKSEKKHSMQKLRNAKM